ncbi:histone deacetylase 11 isoform X1 [Malaclemys terrapin pileata]|uniref:histone deacetylase 11 isoform X1 n=2 Tax=Malaclemys terrapin pileata TaxID=2991368 RepID=UPI0023A8C50A|nr:histone deacetylase 11 isoform X1 [Malaclemys terrapin pileata]
MPHRTELYHEVPPTCWPIVYSPDYNITFMGLEKLHPFDAGKWGKVINFLKGKKLLPPWPCSSRKNFYVSWVNWQEEKLIADDLIVQAREATEEDLLVVHTRRYLNKLKNHILEGFQEWSFVVATITEIPPVLFLPNFLVQRKVLKPLRTQTGGTIMAGKLAIDRGWAINVGGGFHHCSSDKGGGFCAYADITLAIKFLFERVEGVSKATIIDLDAHQGNGHERDFMDDHRVYIMDVYNRYIYPGDGFAKRAIKRKVELDWGTEDTEYLQKVQTHVEGALNESRPDIIIYNAGTDILDGDPLGGLAISPQGIVKRDEVVFRAARSHRIPILMVTSGGYQKRTARIIADSILNLHNQGLIDKELATSEAKNPKVELMIRESILDLTNLSLQ